MAVGKLTLRFMERVSEKGRHSDGGGLYLQVGEGGKSKSWVFKYQVPGQPGNIKWLGLGSYFDVTADEAREKRRQLRNAVREGRSPLEEKHTAQARAKAANTTFQEYATQWWNKKHSQEVKLETAGATKRRLEIHVYPTVVEGVPFGQLPLRKLDTTDPSNRADILIKELLEPIWKSKYVTAEQLRQNVEAILDHAMANKFIPHGRNAASYKDSSPLRTLLPQVHHRVNHHEGIPHQEVGKLVAWLRNLAEHPTRPASKPPAQYCAVCDNPRAKEIAEARAKGASHSRLYERFGQFGITPSMMSWHVSYHLPVPFRRVVSNLCFEFMIMTGCRKHMAAEARWDEIDLKTRLWSCSEHKKVKQHGGAPYVAYLNDGAMNVLTTMKERQEACGINSPFVFTGEKRVRSHLSEYTLNSFMKKTVRKANPDWATITNHGFRETLASWAKEAGYTVEEIKIGSGRLVGDATERRYTRGADLYNFRRRIMDEWGSYCDRSEPLPADIIQFTRAAK
jgi:integrase